VVDPLGLDTAGRAAALQLLTQRFVPSTRSEWPTLWPPMTRTVATTALWTYLDTARDPVVGQLREWIATEDAVRMPVYPAAGALDLRPIEVVPPALQAMAPDVWPLLRAAGLARCCAKLVPLYQQSTGRAVRAASATHDERLRQWRRITNDGQVQELPYRSMGDCLGWFGPGEAGGGDTAVVRALTHVLLRSRPEAPLKVEALWYNTGASPVLWRWAACLWEMRVATVFVSRLRLAGVDLRHLARDIEQHAAV
jgi:hypothetical protein